MDKIKDLKPRQQDVNIEAEVIEKGEVREFSRFGKVGRVCSAKIKDDSDQRKYPVLTDIGIADKDLVADLDQFYPNGHYLQEII